jgi:hypothetical protein
MNWERIKEAVKNDVPTDQLEFYAGDLVINLLDYEREKAVKVNEPVEVTGLGTGFMLIKKEVIEQLKDKVELTLEILRNNYSAKYNTWFVSGITENNLAVFFAYREELKSDQTLKIRGIVKRLVDRATQLNRVKIVGDKE